MKLTPEQQALLKALQAGLKEEGAAPTLRGLAKRLKYASDSPVRHHLKALVKMGLVKIEEGVHRGLRMTERAVGIPLLGRVPAGPPNLAEEFVEDHLPIAGYFRQAQFALKVKGDSMRDAGILDGDTVLVASTSQAKAKDIVVARVKGEATVKRLVKKDGHWTLCPENPRYAPIALGEGDEIIGVVVGVVRKYP
jgi:repressor LexA